MAVIERGRRVNGGLEERFWAKVRKGKGCWFWTAATSRDGYGVIGVDGTATLAHRVGFVIQVGPIPAGHGVFHRCDNPPCVRGDHLFTGPPSDNVADMDAKGRRRHPSGDDHWTRRASGAVAGSRNGRAKLTPDQVAQMRRLYDKGDISTITLASMFGISKAQAYRVVARKQWG